MNTQPPSPRYIDRNEAILEHVMRYRMTTPAVLHRLFFEDSERNAVTKVTSRLCDQRMLASHCLHGSHVYFSLGKAGARHRGLRAGLVKPLGPQAIYREYGILSFCCLGQKLRTRLRFAEIYRDRPQLIAKHLDSSHYYLDRESKDSGTRLGYIWVEAGGSTDHIIRTVQRKIIEPRLSVPTLRELIHRGQFLVAIVTYHEEKRRQILEALSGLRATTVTFRVEVFPELQHLLTEIR